MVVSIFCILSYFTVFLIDTKASDKASIEIPEFAYSSKEKNQVFGHFIIDLYQDEIMKALKEYYKDSEINGFGLPSKQYNIVSIYSNKDQRLKGLEKYSYVLKITLFPASSNGKFLGTDTLYFSVEPSRQSMKNLPKEYPPIELIRYEHSKSSKNTK